MGSNSNEIPIDRKLGEIYAEGYELYESFSSRSDPTNSSDFQLAIKKCIGHFEDSTRLVSLCGIFSANENYKELPVNDLKYLLLPYFLGQLTLKLSIGDRDRSEIVEAAEVYYLDFLKRCNEYGFPEAEQSKMMHKHKNQGEAQMNEFEMLTQAAEDRNTKIQKFREKKQLDEQVAALKILMERDHEDDSTIQEFYTKFIKSCILETFDEISSIVMEKQMIEHMKKIKHDNPDLENQRKKVYQPKPLKPIIITRDAAQKAVYGLGYPSRATMTVAEFYEDRVREGIFPDGSQPSSNSMQRQAEMESEEQEEKEKEDIENMTEQDDERLLARNRAMDDWKDEHRRGEGNRYNRS